METDKPVLFKKGAGTPVNSYWGENFLVNILYNLGFQFTDIMDIIFIDPSNKDPFWYYVSFKLGDFLIRFVFRDEDL